jgi:hypothetical protein
MQVKKKLNAGKKQEPTEESLNLKNKALQIANKQAM